MKDDLDRQIIASLKSDGRAAVANIAASLGVARTTVHERIVRMEKTGVIQGYSVILSDDFDQPEVKILILIEVRQRETRTIVTRLATHPEVRQCLSINGEYDLFVVAGGPKIDVLDRLVDDIASIPGVIRTNTFVVFDEKLRRR